MGNRGGALHDHNREIVRQYASRRWITCLLEFKERRRSVMSPGHYTELFFLDEAVALAAGHRPCAECRRERFNAFKSAWIEPRGGGPLLADEIDTELHRSRIDRARGKVSYQSSLNSLPDGCFIQIEGSNCLVWGDMLLLWSPTGYVKKCLRPVDATVTVLTPAPVVRCIRRGYKPVIHESALSL
jgi:hypothetical protein